MAETHGGIGAWDAGARAREVGKGRSWHGTGCWLGRGGAVLTAALLLAGLGACGGDGNPAGHPPGETTTGGPESASAVVRPASDVTASATVAAVPGTTAVETQSPGEAPPAPDTEVTGPITYARAAAAYADGRYDDAVSLFRAYANRKPDNAWGHYMLGLSAWKAGRAQLAEEGFRAALDRAPDHLKSLVNLSRVLLEENRPDDAAKPIEHALDVSPRDPAALRVAGNVRTAQGRLEDAEHLYRESALQDPDQAWTLNDLGLALVRLGRYEDALAPLARAVTLRPGEPTFQNNLGIALERTGHPDQAADAYRSALAAAPTYQKAEISLERVKGRSPGPGVTPVDLAALAETFTVASRPPVRPDSSGR